jgi:hypothetical protein
VLCPISGAVPPNEIVRGRVAAGMAEVKDEADRPGSNPTIRELFGMTVLPKRSEAGFSSGGVVTAVAVLTCLRFLKKLRNDNFI